LTRASPRLTWQPYNEAAARDKERAASAKAEYDANGGSGAAPASKKAAAPKKAAKKETKKAECVPDH
jgi:hypothetical protein